MDGFMAEVSKHGMVWAEICQICKLGDLLN